MGIVRSGHFWQLGSIASLATETPGGEILVAFWPKHGLRSDLKVPNFIKFSWGSQPCTQTSPLFLFFYWGEGRVWVRDQKKVVKFSLDSFNSPVPKPSHYPVFDHLQYVKLDSGKAWEQG